MRFSTFLMAAGMALSGSVVAQTKWDMPTPYAATNFHTENIQQFANEVDKATAGKLKIQVHANASLLKMNEIKRGIQSGQVQIGEILLTAYSNESPLLELDGVPFLATGYVDAMKLYKASRKPLDDLFAKQGMKILFSVPWPPQGIYSKKPINSAADLKGSKWRAYSPATAKIAELVGATPVRIEAAELSQALATGGVESYMSSGSTGFDTKTYEHLKNWYDTQAWLPKDAVLVSQKAFDALDKPTQDALLKASAEAESRGWKVSQEKNDWYKAQLREKGMNIVAPPAQLMGDMKKVGEVMVGDWLKKSGSEGQSIVDAFKKM